MRFDPAKPVAPEKMGVTMGLRAATLESADGFIYGVAQEKGGEATIWALNTKTEKVESLGSAVVGTQNYITSIDVDPTGRYLYYIPGAHGSGERDGSPIVQFDVKTKTRKVLAYVAPYYAEKYGATLKGTYSSALDAAGEKLYITWNTNRGSKAWDTVSVTVVHIPAEERGR